LRNKQEDSLTSQANSAIIKDPEAINVMGKTKPVFPITVQQPQYDKKTFIRALTASGSCANI